MAESSDLFATALSLLKRGQTIEAERLLRQLCQQTHTADPEYDEWLRGLAMTYRALGRHREAGHVLVYLHMFDAAIEEFAGDGAHADAARAREMWARATKPPAEASPLFLGAARAFAETGLPVEAAICYSLGGSAAGARAEWDRVARDPRLADKPYEQALCNYNLGLCAKKAGDRDTSQRLLARAQRLLEEVADDFEARGERERAFDCFAIVLQLGREENSFENLAEGYINCIRVLKEDNLKFYVLQYYEDFLRLALEREEFHAAAGVCKEAADYARRLGLVYDRAYLKRSAEIWWQAAEKNERIGGPVELTENAYLAAVDAYSGLGDFFHVRESYERLARIGLADKKRERYARVARRYEGVAESHVQADEFPDYLRQQHAYPPIWELDLVEWEMDGDPLAVCGSIVGDTKYPSMIRRKGLQVLLRHFDGARHGSGEAEPERLAEIAQGLGELQAYPALRPLEKMFGHPSPRVRRGVMRALRNNYYKRTFPLLWRGFRDDTPEVRDAAIDALETLHFAHAFDPLTRIFRDHPDQRVKETALTCIGRIGSLEAGVFLIDVLRYENDRLREVARRLLSNFDNKDIFPILRRHVEVESGPARNDMLAVLRGAPAMGR